MPTYVLTLLLPFDGLITYGTSLVFTAVRLDHEEVSALEGMLGECKAAGNIVRTARQFIQAVPLALEEERQLLREALESLGDAPQLGPGTHVGALAGLGTEERSEALSDHACEQRPLPADHYARMFDRVSINCAPKATLREYLASQSLKELRRTAQRFRVKTSGARDGKNQIIRAIMDPSYFNYDEMTGEILLNGDVAAEGLRDCYEAGGRIVVPDSEVTSLDALPQPIEPYLVIFHDRGKFCAQLFQEAMDWLSDARVASIMERTRIVDSIIDYARLVVDFRGVVDAFDVVDEAIDALGFADMSLGREYIVMLIAMRAKVDGIALGFNVAWQDGDTYLMAADLLDGTGAIALDDEGRERVGFVLEDHEGFEPRPVEDLPDTCGGAFEWMEGTPEYRSLLGFLDAPVPDGANDYEYADDALLEVFTCSRFVYDIFIDDALDVLATRGYDPSDDEERERVVRLLQDFYEATPKWQLNGWALTEMEAHEL